MIFITISFKLFHILFRFLLQDASGKFLQDGHKKAVAAKKEKESKSKQQFGAKGVQNRVGPQQEKNIWLTLVDHLSRKDKLPVVAFTLSRYSEESIKEQCVSVRDDLTSQPVVLDPQHWLRYNLYLVIVIL